MTRARWGEDVPMNKQTTNSDPSDYEPGPLTRSADRRIIAGVCGGFEEHFGVDAWWFRAAFLILGFFGLVGILLYVMAWLLMPRPYGEPSVINGWMEGLDLRNTGTMIGVGLIALAALILLSNILEVSSALVFAFALGIAGIMLYRGDLRPGGSTVSDDDSTDDHEDPVVESASSRPAPEGGAVATRSGVALTTPPRARRQRRERPPKSMLGRLTLASVLVVVSTMALFDLGNVVHFQPVGYLAAALVVIAGGLLVGAVVGRARWLVFVGLMLLPLLMLTALLPRVENWSVGTSINRPLSLDEVNSSYSLGMGELTIDLRALSPSNLAKVGRIEAVVSLGELTVLLPAGVGAVVEASVGVGAVEIYGGGTTHNAIFQNCVEEGFALHECEHLSTDTLRELGVVHDVYWNPVAGLGVSSTYEVGDAPRDLVLDLQVGAGVVTVRSSTITTSESRG